MTGPFNPKSLQVAVQAFELLENCCTFLKFASDSIRLATITNELCWDIQATSLSREAIEIPRVATVLQHLRDMIAFFASQIPLSLSNSPSSIILQSALRLMDYVHANLEAVHEIFFVGPLANTIISVLEQLMHRNKESRHEKEKLDARIKTTLPNSPDRLRFVQDAKAMTRSDLCRNYLFLSRISDLIFEDVRAAILL